MKYFINDDLSILDENIEQLYHQVYDKDFNVSDIRIDEKMKTN